MSTIEGAGGAQKAQGREAMNEPTTSTNEEKKERFPLRTKILGFTILALLGLLMWGVLAGTAYVFGIPDKVILAVILAFLVWEGVKDIEFRRAQNIEAHRNFAAHIERLEETIKKLEAEGLPWRLARLEVLTGHGGVWPPSEGFRGYMRNLFFHEELKKRDPEYDARLTREVEARIKPGMSLDQIRDAMKGIKVEGRYDEISRRADERYRAWEREQFEDEGDLEDETL
jgi:hypothetical protein